MAADFRRLLRLYALYARMDAAWLVNDTRNCLLALVAEGVSAVASVAGVFLIAVRFGGVGALSADEVLFMLGFATAGEGLYMLFFNGNNTGDISRRVGRGQVDHMLMQPLPLWMQMLAEGFLPVSGGATLISGGVILWVAASRVALPGYWLWLLAAMLFFRLALSVAISYLAGAAAFYRPISYEELSSVAGQTLNSLSRYPLAGLHPALLCALNTVLPAGLLAWLPTMVILQKTQSALSAWLLPLAAMLAALLAAKAFRKGLVHYGKTGSSRYRDMGHRR